MRRSLRLTCAAWIAACGGTTAGSSATIPTPDASTPDAPASPCEGGACPCATMCAGQCVDEPTDPNNCGGCGVKCAGTCTFGRCLVTLATRPAKHLVLDAANVYWTELTSGIEPGAVTKTPIDGGASTVLASGQIQPNGIAVDATNVYWTTDYGTVAGSVNKVPIAGGPSTTLASAQNQPGPIATDGVNIYWAGNDGIMKLPVAGGTATMLVSGGGNFVLEGTDVYWLAVSVSGTSTSTVLMKVGLDGSGLATLGSAPGDPGTLVRNATRLVWATYGYLPQYTTLLEIPVGGGPITTVVAASCSYYAPAIAADATSVYWTQNAMEPMMSCAGPSTLMKSPLDGAAPIPIAADARPLDIAVDSTSVYWATSNGLMKLTPK